MLPFGSYQAPLLAIKACLPSCTPHHPITRPHPLDVTPAAPSLLLAAAPLLLVALPLLIAPPLLIDLGVRIKLISPSG